MIETFLIMFEVPEEHLQDVLPDLHKIHNMPDEIHFAKGQLAADIIDLFWAARDDEEEM